MGQWIFGAALGLAFLIGLFIASRAHDGPFAIAGYALSGLALALIFWLIARNTGQPRQRS